MNMSDVSLQLLCKYQLLCDVESQAGSHPCSSSHPKTCTVQNRKATVTIFMSHMEDFL